MARRSTNHLTELELLIMRVVWHAGDDVSVDEIHEALERGGRPLALPSVRTMLKILRDKGYLTRHADGRRHLYRATVREDAAQRGILKEVVERAFDGSAVDLMTALLDGKMVRPGDVEKVRAMLDEAEAAKKKKSGKRRSRS